MSPIMEARRGKNQKSSHLQSVNARIHSSAGELFVPNVGLHPLLSGLSSDIQNGSANYAHDSRIDVLAASGTGQDICELMPLALLNALSNS